MRQIRSVGIEKAGRNFNVVITNINKQTIRPITDVSLNEAMTEASDWADFCGVKLTPYVFNGITIRAVERGTYKFDEPKSVEVLVAEYRNPKTAELNWNKLTYWEWDRCQPIYGQKDELLKALVPYYIEAATKTRHLDDGVEREWLSSNCVGVWKLAKGGARFSLERDATLFKLFFYGV